MDLTPGVYVLSRAVENPGADGRRRGDWRYWKTIPKDTRFFVREIDGEWKGPVPVEMVLSRDRVSCRSIYRSRRLLGKYNDLWDLLVQALVPIQETLVERFCGLGVRPDQARFLVDLIDHGLPVDHATEAVKLYCRKAT